MPPWLQALKVPSLNKAENMERRKLQEQLQSLERQYNSAKSWEEQKKIGMIYWKPQPEKAFQEGCRHR